MVYHHHQHFSITLNNPYGDSLMGTQNNNSRLLDDKMVDMKFITEFTGLTDKWFYKLISEGKFPEPIKLGRSSRWMQSEVEKWVQERIDLSRG
ncbi:hypothetical protein SB6419_00212 [Klebsiella spallanzanii]|nr:hypothetical protein SB6419_00212 [Klebsiella spallanzanii]